MLHVTESSVRTHFIAFLSPSLTHVLCCESALCPHIRCNFIIEMLGSWMILLFFYRFCGPFLRLSRLSQAHFVPTMHAFLLTFRVLHINKTFRFYYFIRRIFPMAYRFVAFRKRWKGQQAIGSHFFLIKCLVFQYPSR